MQNSIARLSVLALLATGFTASTIVPTAAPKKHEIKPIVIGTRCPAPMCTPHSGDYCGMD